MIKLCNAETPHHTVMYISETIDHYLVLTKTCAVCFNGTLLTKPIVMML